MQLDRARRVFATHMAAARTRKLTAYELQELSRARQVLRRSRRPAGQSKNPKQVIKARHADVFVHNKVTAKKARKILREGRAQGRPLTPAQRGFFGARASGYPPKPKKNPSGLIRMGRLIEIRYHRDHGRAKGFYKHPFKQRPEIFYRPSDNTILIKG